MRSPLGFLARTCGQDVNGAPSDWAELARKSPYVLDGGVLVPRALAPRAGAHDRPILSF